MFSETGLYATDPAIELTSDLYQRCTSITSLLCWGKPNDTRLSRGYNLPTMGADVEGYDREHQHEEEEEYFFYPFLNLDCQRC